MIEFEEPGDDYRLEKLKDKDVKVRANVVTMFMLFLFLVMCLVFNNFNFNFASSRAAELEQKCDEKNAYNWNDEEEIYMEKANAVLADNHQQFLEAKGFEEAYVETEPIGYKNADKPVIKMFFEDVAESSVEIPERLCGYRVEAFFR